MKRVIWYGILITGLVLICLPAFAQGLFPGLEVRDMKNWLMTFAVGAAFTVLWYAVKRYIDTVDKKNEMLMREIDKLSVAVVSLTLETKLHRKESNGYDKDINILKNVTNALTDFKNKHIQFHAKCRICPEIE